MIIYPAIDLRAGRCVRLRQGDPQAQTVYSEDPVAMAQHWAGLGAAWLHLVNLDGALEEADASACNLQALERILAAVAVPVQFGGGLRTIDAIARVLDMGATRIILGTAAVRDPALVETALARFGAPRIVAGIDAHAGQVAIRGWQERTTVDATTLGQALHRLGIERAVYTDIARDGMLSGPNITATAALARETGLRVIASGGISRLEDVQALAALEAEGIEGAIIGQALYTGAIDLPAALAVLRQQNT